MITSPAATVRRIRTDERGAGYLAAFIVLFSVLTVAGVGILVDSARVWSTHRQVNSIAFEASRAGANALNIDLLGEGQIAVDPHEAEASARAAAEAFVSNSRFEIVSVAVDGTRVTVRVQAHVESWFPMMSDRTVTGEATADATRGP